MVSYGLNTVRIPVGYWFLESIVDKSEHFPQGGEKFLDQVVGWAKDAGLYVIIGLHGAPGGQATDPFTGQFNPKPGFYSEYNYDRAYKWLEWMTEKVHTNPSYSTVGMLELLNEPERLWDTDKYPDVAANSESLRKVSFVENLDKCLPLTSPDLLSHGMVEDPGQGV
jgi:aryl-phospho-beta-D-glucosidase BglC (GH1 family)